MIKRVLLASLLILAAGAARGVSAQDGGEIVPSRDVPSGVRQAAQESRTQEDETPAALRWMLKPLKRGMFVRLPVIDTDPNRGVTYGIMPIVVLQGGNEDRIEQIHAPSLTYNKNFGISPTYRYYYYPHDDAVFVGRASRARYEHEAMAEYEDHSFAGTDYDVLVRFWKNRDAGQRFYGFGPDAPKSAEANYTQDYWQYNWGVGVPLRPGSPFRAHLSQRYIAGRILDGPLQGLPRFSALFPQQYSARTQQTNETRVSLDYDTRDLAATPGSGVYANVFAETAVRGFLSQYDYSRCGADARWFLPVPGHAAHVVALQGRYEQLVGPTVPAFWLMPSLGGKYSLRAYGDGRYADRGTATINVEDRIKLYEARTAGVTTEFQVAPFVGAGSVFDIPQEGRADAIRPVVGTALRVVAKPQVVGSVDFGVGREGLSVFTDINYSF